MVGSNQIWLCPYKKGNQDTDTLRKRAVWKQERETAIDKPKKKHFTRNQPCWHLHLGYPPSRLWGNKFLLFKPLHLLYLLQQPQKTNTVPSSVFLGFSFLSPSKEKFEIRTSKIKSEVRLIEFPLCGYNFMLFLLEYLIVSKSSFYLLPEILLHAFLSQFWLL